jgi:tetratricopeptide (TPR) repeat protein
MPPGLARVVDRALAKDPAKRYANSAELLADLESGRVRGRRLSRRKALRVIFLLGALAALLVLALWRPWQAVSGPPVRVAILQPVVVSEGNNPETDFIASDVQRAVLATLVSLESVQPLDPPERNEVKGLEAERLREADEGLMSLLDCREGSCQVTFRRRKPDGVISAVSEPFEVQGGFENAYQLAEGVRVHVQQVYSGHRLRPEAPGGDVRPEDYSAYIALERRSEGGESLGKAELNQLDALLRTSPSLIGAYVLATGAARRQGDVDRSLDYATRAEKIAPYDPRPLIVRLRAEVEGDRLDTAPATLARLESLAPGDIRVKTARADLLEAQGKLKEALSLLKEVVRRRPTWRHILKLATLEFRSGESDSARRRLEDLSAAQPDNQSVQESLANLETLYGDPQRAAVLYEELISTGQAAPYLTTNLGFVRYLLGEYAAAEAAYRQSLSQDTDDLMTRFNMATALEAQGDLARAQRLYRVLEKELAAAPAQQDAHTRMLHAQCLVRLGQRADAALITREVLKQTAEDLQTRHQAAQVYALLGERIFALYYAELVLREGISRAWFTIPEFRSLEKSSDFQELLDRYTTPKTVIDPGGL